MKDKKGVALEYSGKAPRVIAKARGRLMEKLLDIAKENGITVYRDPDLTELLTAIDVGREIPVELYRAVSEVLAYCYRVNGVVKTKIDSEMIDQ